MDLERVREFLVIAEEKSFKKAAERLGIAPNVLSARYQTFENTLETTLLIRNAHRTELTESGRLFLQNAKELIASYDRILDDLKESENTAYRSLTFEVCGVTMDAPELGIFLDLYNRRHPQAYLELLSDNAYSITEGLSSGNIDIAVAYGNEDAFSDISGRVCISHASNLCVYVPTDHPLALKSQITFQELENEQFLLYPDTAEPCIRRHQLDCLNRSGIHYTIYSGRYDPVFYNLFVPIGKGIILTPIVAPPPPNSNVLHITDAGYDTYTYLLYNANTTNEATLEFINEFQDFLRGTI